MWLYGCEQAECLLALLTSLEQFDVYCALFFFLQDTSGGGGAPRLATVAIGWETDPAKDPTGYVGKPIREYWYKAVAKDDETPSQVCSND